MSEIGQDDGPNAEVEPGASPNGGALDALLGKVSGGMNALGSAWIFVLMILINIDAGGRTWFAAPMDGVVEMIELTLIAIVFLQLGDATRAGRLTRSDGFFKIIQVRKPAVGRFLGALFDGLGLAFMVIILWGGIPILIESYVEDFYVGTEGIFTAPVWPVKLIIVFGAALMALQFAVFARRYIIGHPNR